MQYKTTGLKDIHILTKNKLNGEMISCDSNHPDNWRPNLTIVRHKTVVLCSLEIVLLRLERELVSALRLKWNRNLFLDWDWRECWWWWSVRMQVSNVLRHRRLILASLLPLGCRTFTQNLSTKHWEDIPTPPGQVYSKKIQPCANLNH